MRPEKKNLWNAEPKTVKLDVESLTSLSKDTLYRTTVSFMWETPRRKKKKLNY